MSVLVPKRRFAMTQRVLISAILFAATRAVSGHEGPPFPILMDQPLAGYSVSVWADPDIGEAQFFIILETPDGGLPEEAPAVSLWVEPVNGRLPRVTREGTRQDLRNHMQFEAKPHFDQQDMWTVGITLAGSSGTPAELTTQVESTPPGYGVWDLLIYLFPFLLLGILWILAMSRRNRILQMSRDRQSSRMAKKAPQADHDSMKSGSGMVESK